MSSSVVLLRDNKEEQCVSNLFADMSTLRRV